MKKFVRHKAIDSPNLADLFLDYLYFKIAGGFLNVQTREFVPDECEDEFFDLDTELSVTLMVAYPHSLEVEDIEVIKLDNLGQALEIFNELSQNPSLDIVVKHCLYTSTAIDTFIQTVKEKNDRLRNQSPN